MSTKHWRCARVYAADVPSSTKEDVTYRVSMVASIPHCSCPGFLHAGHCKHGDALLEVACLWDTERNPRGHTAPIDNACPICSGPVVTIIYPSG